jgi:integrase
MPPARDALAAIRPDGEHSSGPLLRGRRGPYGGRGLRYLLRAVGIRAKVEAVHPHRFRHDTARRLVEATDLPTVAAWLGHERLDTVCVYSQPDEAALERAAARWTHVDAAMSSCHLAG